MLVSVFIPTRNRRQLLCRAITSVLTQNYKNLELIVVDDCSDDASSQMVLEFAASDSRVRLIRNDSQLGACKSRNRALLDARGDFITGLDDDDWFEKDRIGAFVNAWDVLRSNKVPFAYLFTNQKVVVGDGRVEVACIDRRSVANRNCLLAENVVGNQWFLDSQTYRDLCYDPDFRMWQDLDFLFRLSELGPGLNIRNYSYVVDPSHGADRISSSGNAEEVVQLFRKKHRLSWLENQALRNHLIHYQPKNVSFFSIIVSQFFCFDGFRFLRHMVIAIRAKVSV